MICCASAGQIGFADDELKSKPASATKRSHASWLHRFDFSDTQDFDSARKVFGDRDISESVGIDELRRL